MRTLLAVLLLSCVGAFAADYYPPLDRTTPYWHLAGVPGGVPSANWPIFVNLRTTGNASYLCAADGITDDWAKINAAINDCPSGQVVYAPAGIYRFTKQFFFPNRAPMVIRGDGPGLTIFKGQIAVENDGSSFFWFGQTDTDDPPAGNIFNIYSGHSKGSSNISTTASFTSAGIAVDDLLLVDQLNDAGWGNANGLVTSMGWQGGSLTNPASFADRDRDGTRNLHQTVRVLSVNNGTNIVYWPPLNWDFNSALSPQVTLLGSGAVLKNVGWEDFTLTNANATGNTHGGHQQFIIYGANQCWIKNVETADAKSYHMFWFQQVQSMVIDCYIHGHTISVNDRPYGIEIRFATSFLLQNNIFDNCFAAIAINSGGSGNVIAYNFVTNSYTFDPTLLSAAINSAHAAFTMMNLYEGNVCNEIQADYFWGSSGLNTYFRNRVTGTDAGVTQNRKPISMDRNSLSNNIINNVLGLGGITWQLNVSPAESYPFDKNVIYRMGYPGIGQNGYIDPPDTTAASYDSRVLLTAIIHGNYDFATSSTINSNGLPTTHLNSYYLAGKPEWFSNSPFPPIGAEIVGTDSIHFHRIPSQRKFLKEDYSNRYGTPRGQRSFGIGF